jgi:flavin reductase (DIM6/NTAB) family NADH-FMN oxidoreductase RutF
LTTGTRRAHHNIKSIGLTINWFVSVSMDLPLAARNLKREARHANVFAACSHFAVDVLAADQQALSTRFASVRRRAVERRTCCRTSPQHLSNTASARPKPAWTAPARPGQLQA